MGRADAVTHRQIDPDMEQRWSTTGNEPGAGAMKVADLEAKAIGTDFCGEVSTADVETILLHVMDLLGNATQMRPIQIRIVP